MKRNAQAIREAFKDYGRKPNLNLAIMGHGEPEINHDRVISNQVGGMPLEEAIFQDGYSAGVEFEKKRAKQGAVWVKASERLPSAGKITWRWLDKAEAYSGYDEKRGFIFGTGGASVDPTYYTEIEWLDESGQSKEGNKEQYKFDYKSRDWEQEQTKPASEEAIRRMKERWIAEGKRECPDCGLWFKSEGRCPECNPLG
jgi:hypothetical protein